MNIKECIVKSIGFDFSELGSNVENLIIESISADKGDYSLPCFSPYSLNYQKFYFSLNY